MNFSVTSSSLCSVTCILSFEEYSSASAYGAWPDNKLWIKETQELRPRDYHYGINKKIVENYMNKFKKRTILIDSNSTFSHWDFYGTSHDECPETEYAKDD